MTIDAEYSIVPSVFDIEPLPPVTPDTRVGRSIARKADEAAATIEAYEFLFGKAASATHGIRTVASSQYRGLLSDQTAIANAVPAGPDHDFMAAFSLRMKQAGAQDLDHLSSAVVTSIIRTATQDLDPDPDPQGFLARVFGSR
jgi:hypothetical protein